MVFVFICKKSGKAWTATGSSASAKDLTAEGDSVQAIEKSLKEVIRKKANWQGPFTISHSPVTPNSSVFVCHLGAASVPSVGAAAPAAAAPAAGGAAAGGDKKGADKKEAPKKKEPEPEEEDTGFAGGLFD